MAGYAAEMDRMLDSNQGLRSRFTVKVHFEDFTTPLVEQLIRKKLFVDGMKLSGDAELRLNSVADRLRSAPKFANGRDVTNFCDKLFQQVAGRASGADDEEDDEFTIEPIDLEGALAELLKMKPAADSGTVTTPVPSKQSFPMASVQAQQSAPPPPAVSHAVIAQEETADVIMEEAADQSGGVEPHLVVLQTILDQRGLNSAEGVEYLSTLSTFDEEFIDLAQEIATALNISLEEASAKLTEWQSQQADVREKMKAQQTEMEVAKKEKRQALLPIWRCGVCGAADKPYIACSVAPFIVRYEMFPVNA
eukprot:gene32361-39952_t